MKTLIVTELDRVIYVKLHRPEVRNAFNPEMISEITQLFQKLASRTDLIAITLQGEGKAFCAGADLTWMKEMVKYNFDQNLQDSEKLYDMFGSIESCPTPVIGVAHGAVFGGALGLVACCDYVIAEANTQFCFSEVKLGLAPAVISSFILRKAPRGLVQPLMMSGQIFSAVRGLQMGLLHDVFEFNAEKDMSQQLNQELSKVLHIFKNNGGEAVRATKKLVSTVEELSLKDQKAISTQVIAERRVSPEGQEGLKAFLEKRSPSWIS